MSGSHSSFPRSTVLVLGHASIHALLPSTLISQVDGLLDAHRIADAARLAEQHRKKVLASTVVREHEADELRYVSQRLGFQCLSEALFEDAGAHLFAGELDPRVLVSYFPDLVGGLLGEEEGDGESVEMFKGVEEYMPREESVDEIIVLNLVTNYSPHLPPSTREARPTVELRRVLNVAARDMLEVYLRKWRARVGMVTSERAESLRKVIDTVLVKMYATHADTMLLTNLIDEPNFVLIPEVEGVLQDHERFSTLCKLYLQRGEEGKLMDAWAKLVEGQWVDKSVQDPLTSMFVLLTESRDRALIQKWIVWLTKRDPMRALKLLTSSASGKRKVDEERALLKDIQNASASAGAQYLEYLVLQKRLLDPELHTQLALQCLENLLACLAEETTEKLWRAKEASYASSHTDTPFLTYFASTTPDSEPKRTRLKAALFLQGSTLFDPASIRAKLGPHERVLRLEAAILDGKLGQHESALTILVHDLHDSTSAEAYCTLGGEVIPSKTAQTLGERYELKEWAAVLVPAMAPTPGKKMSAASMSRLKTVDAGVKKELIGVLLKVYMSGGESTADRTARFLNAQAMNLDVLDVISLIPPSWPLRVLSTFLTRSFRRTLHAAHEGAIVKAISAGENLAVTDAAWGVLREQGAMVEEPASDEEADEGPGEGEGETELEKGVPQSFDEKVTLGGVGAGAGQEDDRTETATVDIPPDRPESDSDLT